MTDRLAERSADFLSAYERLKEALAQSENSFLRDASPYDEAQAIRVYQFIKRDGIELFSELAVKVRSWNS